MLSRTDRSTYVVAAADVAAADAAAGGDGKKVAQFFLGLSAVCTFALVRTLIAQPLYPFKLQSLAWTSTWLWMTIVDYYGATIPFCAIIFASEKPKAAWLWSGACLVLGCPFCCLYVATRAWRHGSLKLTSM